MRLIDSHAHLDMKDRLSASPDVILERAWENNLVAVIAVAGATRVGQFEQTFGLAKKHRRVFTTAGIHPHAADAATPDALDKLRFALDAPKNRALGEIGLDYHYNYSDPKEQRRAFIAQVKMAHKARLPVVVHTREADEDTLAILKDEGACDVGGVIHCFSSGETLAREALNLGLYLSFSGIVTFPRSVEIQKVAAWAPVERILVETDAPFLAPVPHRGRPNEPAHVRHVAEKIAQLRDIELEPLAEATVKNTLLCFGIDESEIA